MLRLTATLLLALAGVALLSRPPQGGRLSLRSAVPNATPVKLLARSHLSLTADLAWIRMSSMATQLRTADDGLALLQWGQFVTDLDPHLMWAYGMGGLLGPVREADRTANVPEALALLEKGTRALPGEFRLFIYLAFTQLDAAGDAAGAAATLRRAARIPGAPAYLGPLAARLLAQSGQFGAAREFARQMAESGDEATRETFQRRVQEIDREEAWTRLDRAVADFQAARGRPPARLAELVEAGLLGGLPVDPLGGQFELQPDGGILATSGPRLHFFKQEEPRP